MRLEAVNSSSRIATAPGDFNIAFGDMPVEVIRAHAVARTVANRLPHFCVFGKAKDHDSKKEDELFSSLKEGDIGIADRAYNHFKALYRQTTPSLSLVICAA